MKVLETLADQAGEVVSRQALLDTVWADAVVGDEVLSRAISLLRGYFQDDRTNPSYIRTVPRQGYELIQVPRPLGRDRRSTVLRAASVSALLAVVVVVGWWVASEQDAGPRPEATLFLEAPASADPDINYIGNGVVEHLASRLSRESGLDVVWRRTGFGVQGAPQTDAPGGDPPVLDYRLSSSLDVEDTQFQLTLELVEAATGATLWQRAFQASLVAELERAAFAALSRYLTEAAIVAVAPEARVEASVPDEAYRKYLEARYQWSLRGEQRIERSIQLLEACLALAPSFAPAHLALAQTLATQPFYSDMPLTSQFERAREHAGRAVDLASELEPEAMALEGFMLMKEWQWLAAGQTLREAVHRDPLNVNARYWLSTYLAQLGRYEASLTEMERAVELDPLSAVFADRLALAYAYVGRLDDAEAQFRHAGRLGYLESNQPLSRLLFLLRTERYGEMAAYLERLGGEASWIGPLVSGLQVDDLRPAAIEAMEAGTESALLKRLAVPVWVLFGDYERALRDFDPNPKTQLIEFLWIEEARPWRTRPEFQRVLTQLGFVGEARRLVKAS